MLAFATRPKPGYVYALETPALPGLVKVGHTHRPPHKRAMELSRTSLPLPFEVKHARFFWDAPKAEKHLHHLFANYRPSRRREFFALDMGEITTAIDSLEHHIKIKTSPTTTHDIDAPFLWRVADDDWAHSSEGLEEQWGWAEEDIASKDPVEQRRGWARMEALSAAGWAEGSWRMADAMMRKKQSEEMAGRAAWVLDAAAAQGHPAAALRAAWLRSFRGTSEMEAWKQQVLAADLKLAKRDILTWPDGIRETIEAELGLWDRHPDRRFDAAIFQAVIKLNARSRRQSP